MNVLSVKNIPEELVQEFEILWENNSEKILKEPFDEKKLLSLESQPINPNSNGFNVLEQSIPKVVEEL